MTHTRTSFVNFAITAALIAFAPFSNSATILKDDFESASLSKTLSSTASGLTAVAKWSTSSNVTASSTLSKSGSYAAKFHFAGNTSSTADAWAELRFDLGGLYKEVWIQYDLYIPSNYQHRSVSPNNNKMLRIWGLDYNEQEKIGFSTWASNGVSSAAPDWNSGTGIGPKGQSSSSWITQSDLGKWMTVKVHVIAATASQNGTLNIWKNGTLVMKNTGTVNNYSNGGVHAFRNGYLLGWSNSGFSQNTDLYIDNVVFATQESDLGSGAPSTASPPSAPILQVK